VPTFNPGWMSDGECAAADARTGRKDGENSSKPAEQDAIPACFSKVPFGLFLRKREEHFALMLLSSTSKGFSASSSPIQPLAPCSMSSKLATGSSLLLETSKRTILKTPSK
jgi:hypothetical protein